MKLPKKIFKRIARIYLRRKGCHVYIENMLAEEFAEELLINEFRIPLRKRIWAWKHGFLADKILIYGLTEDNLKDYLSDLDYGKLFPLNNCFSHWIDDKLSLKYVLSKYDEFLPKYFFLIRHSGTVEKLCDWPAEAKTDDPITLLKMVKCFAAKPYSGSAGKGFYKIEYRDNTFRANGQVMDGEEITSLLKSLKGYIFTEFVQQSKEFEKICPGTAHSLRVQTARMPDGDIRCIFSFIRMGKQAFSSCVTHSTSGVTASVDSENGLIVHPFYFDEDRKYIQTDIHPDSNVNLSFSIPNWEKALKKCVEIHKYLTELDYIGFDLIITDSCFKICEINSYSSIRASQHAFPFWKEPYCSAFFHNQMVKKSKGEHIDE